MVQDSKVRWVAVLRWCRPWRIAPVLQLSLHLHIGVELAPAISAQEGYENTSTDAMNKACLNTLLIMINKNSAIEILSPSSYHYVGVLMMQALLPPKHLPPPN